MVGRLVRLIFDSRGDARDARAPLSNWHFDIVARVATLRQRRHVDDRWPMLCQQFVDVLPRDQPTNERRCHLSAWWSSRLGGLLCLSVCLSVCPHVAVSCGDWPAVNTRISGLMPGFHHSVTIIITITAQICIAWLCSAVQGRLIVFQTETDNMKTVLPFRSYRYRCTSERNCWKHISVGLQGCSDQNADWLSNYGRTAK